MLNFLTELKNNIGNFLNSIEGQEINNNQIYLKNNFITLSVKNLLNSLEELNVIDYISIQKHIFSTPSWPLFVFLVCSFLCLAFSTIFHLFAPHSQRIHDILIKLDISGMGVLGLGTFTPLYFYIFYCNDFLMRIYFSLFTLILFIIFFVSNNRIFTLPKMRKTRSLVLLFTGLISCLPIVHVYFYGY